MWKVVLKNKKEKRFNFPVRGCTYVFSNQLFAWRTLRSHRRKMVESLCVSDNVWSDLTTDWTTSRKNCIGEASLLYGCTYASSYQTSDGISCRKSDTQTDACPNESTCVLITSRSVWSFSRKPYIGMASCSNALSYAASSWWSCWILYHTLDSCTTVLLLTQASLLCLLLQYLSIQPRLRLISGHFLSEVLRLFDRSICTLVLPGT